MSELDGNPCPHQTVYIGDRNYTLRKARQVAQQFECKHCGAFFEKTILFTDFAKPFKSAELERIRREETEAAPIERRKRERAAGHIGIGEPAPILYTPPQPLSEAHHTLGRRLYRARVGAGRSMLEAAKAASLPLGDVSSIEHGMRAFSLAEIEAVAALAGVELTDEDRALATGGDEGKGEDDGDE